MNCRLIKHRPYRTPSIREDQFSVGGLFEFGIDGTWVTRGIDRTRFAMIQGRGFEGVLTYYG
jgi:hypothetical protein